MNRVRNLKIFLLYLLLFPIWTAMYIATSIRRFFFPQEKLTKRFTSELPIPNETPDFVFKIEQVIKMRHLNDLVIIGRVEKGRLILGQLVKIRSVDGLVNFETQIRDIETNHERHTEVHQGVVVGILIPDLTREEIKVGMVMTPAK